MKAEKKKKETMKKNERHRNRECACFAHIFNMHTHAVRQMKLKSARTDGNSTFNVMSRFFIQT